MVFETQLLLVPKVFLIFCALQKSNGIILFLFFFVKHFLKIQKKKIVKKCFLG